MRREIQKFYVHEVFNQCRFAHQAAGGIEHCIQVLSTAEGDQAPDEVVIVFRHLHSFLTHASNISKLFWPIGKKRQNETAQQFEDRVPAIKRGRELRDLYGIQQGNALEKRQLRDNLEHFDERLDDFSAEVSRLTGQAGSYSDMTTGLIAPLEREIPRTHILRHFDYYTRKFIFRGIEYEIIPLARAIEAVQRKSLELW